MTHTSLMNDHQPVRALMDTPGLPPLLDGYRMIPIPPMQPERKALQSCLEQGVPVSVRHMNHVLRPKCDPIIATVTVIPSRCWY